MPRQDLFLCTEHRKLVSFVFIIFMSHQKKVNSFFFFFQAANALDTSIGEIWSMTRQSDEQTRSLLILRGAHMRDICNVPLANQMSARG